MSAPALFLILIPLLAIALLAAVVISVVYVAVKRPAPAPSEAAAAAHRHGAAVNVTAWLLAIGLGLLVLTPVGFAGLRLGAPDSATWTAVLAGAYPAGIGLAFLGAHALGERSWPRPTGTLRRATLVPRGEVAPRWLRRVTWTWAVTLVVTLVATGVTATDGRWIRIAPEASFTESTAGPYPGWDFGVPLLLAALLVLAATEGTLLLVARRPAVVDADPDYDAASRRLSAHRVLRGAQLVLGGTLAVVLVVTGGAIVNAQYMGVGAPLVALGYILAVAVLVITLVPARAAIPSAATPARPESVALGARGLEQAIPPELS